MALPSGGAIFFVRSRLMLSQGMALKVRSGGLLGLLALTCLAAPLSTLGHFGGAAYIVVPVDHVNPGERFEVVGGDLTPNSNVVFRFRRDESTVPVPGTVTSGPDGHFTASLAMPADYPTGYALLEAEAADGTRTTTWVLIGARTSETPAPPGQPAWWTDPSVIVLGVAIAGGIGALGFAAYKRLQPQRMPVGAGSRRRSTGKSQRRQRR